MEGGSFFRYVGSLLLVFMGCMDCLTTVIGTLYFGAQELNPLIAQLVSTNLPAFVVVKLAATFFVGVILVVAERSLVRNVNSNDGAVKFAYNTLRVTYIGMTVFLVLVVTNNVIVLLRTF